MSFLKVLIYKIPIRYFVIILCGYCVDFSIYVVLVSVGVSVYWANAIGFCIGSAVNTILIRNFVFQESKFSLQADLQLSLVSNSMIFILGMMMLWVLIELSEMNSYGAKLLTNGVTFIANYLIRAFFFRKK